MVQIRPACFAETVSADLYAESSRTNQRMTRLPDAALLEDLCSRFVLNVPSSEHESFDRFMFLVEQAHWFYEDHCRLADPELQSLSLKAFTGMLFERCPGLESCRQMLTQIHKSFNSFKSLVPTYGAILLDSSMSKTLLVRGFHTASTWGFPKGKISCNESEMACAIREVLEETSYDISSGILEDDFVEMHIGGRGEDGLGHQKCKLYIIQAVDTNVAFMAKTKGEIGAFAWFRINDLPTTAQATRMLMTGGSTTYKMHGVYPFMKQLRNWIHKKRRKGKANKQGVASHSKQLNSLQNGRTTNHDQNGKTSIEGNSPSSEGGQGAVESLGTTKAAEPGQAWLNFRFDRGPITAQMASRLIK